MPKRAASNEGETFVYHLPTKQWVIKTDGKDGTNITASHTDLVTLVAKHPKAVYRGPEVG